MCSQNNLCLLDNVLADRFYQLFRIIGVCLQLDRLGQIQAENAHDRLCVDGITTGHQINVIVKQQNLVYEILYIIDCIQLNCGFIHNNYLLLKGLPLALPVSQ